MNPAELLPVQADVTVEVIDSSGTVQSSRVLSLQARNRVAAVVSAPLTTGYIRITSNTPLHVLGAIGTQDGRTLDMLPAVQ